MKTKLFVLLLGVFLLATRVQAEVKTIFVTNEQPEKAIEIKEGQLGEVIYASILRPHRNYNNYAEINADIYIEINGVRMKVYIPTLLVDGGLSISKGFSFPVVAGPAKLILRHSGQSSNPHSFISLKISPNDTATSKSAGHALVLPEGEDGKQKLVLESSTDLVSWTEDSLGSKDSSDKKRFYRLRAVKE